MKDLYREFKGHLTLAILTVLAASIVDAVATVLAAYFGG